MAIPGGEKLEPVGKVRIGEKSGKFAKSLNYFRSDVPLFGEICPSNPSEILVGFFADSVEEVFPNGLDWWTQQKGGANVLACYTRDGGSDPIALRQEPYLDPDSVKRGAKLGNNRFPVSCPFRECVHFKAKQCRPIGRLDFYLVSDPKRHLWRLDTKSWNSIEALVPALSAFTDLSKRQFTLSVVFQTKGDKRFPVLGLEEHVIVTEENVEKADALVALAKAKELGQAREGLVAYLNVTAPNWRTNEALVNRIKEIGPDEAIVNIFSREGAR